MSLLLRHARIATLDAARGSPCGWLEDAALIADGEYLRWVGPEAELVAAARGLAFEAEHDLQGALLTPGLVDCHTHLVYAGDRSREAEQRLHGASYEDIARAGGGIRSTVAATRAASEAGLLEATLRRARALMAEGVTTLEIKSGYGLAFEHEARCLRVARRVGERLPVSVRATCLAAHTVPPEHAGQADAYVEAVCEWLPRLQAEGLVDAVDAYCERIAFSPAQVRRVFEAARRCGLPVKLHAEQLSDQGGAQLAAEFRALSCDHLEHLSTAGVEALVRAGSVAVLLPGAWYFLRDSRPPPVEALRAAGVPMAVATDHNPGTSPLLSLPLAMHLACTLFRLTPEEALLGTTRHAARALGLADRGAVVPGLRADLAVWDLQHPGEFAYWFGRRACSRLFIGGREWKDRA